jgi:putative ABC transport system substrate-binding protein
MRRREFIAGLGSTAAWPVTAQAQQSQRMRRIGVLMSNASDDPESTLQVAAFVREFEERGWRLGDNLQIEYRWGAGDADRYRSYAVELVKIAPDVILALGGTAAGALQQVTHTIPIVFVGAGDPVSRGLVASLSRPGGNTTGFSQYEFSISGKWLELLKQIAPRVTRVAVIRDPVQFSGVGLLAPIQTVAPAFGVEVSPIDPRDACEIDRAITAFARGQNDGLIVTQSGSAVRHREPIIMLAARHRMPAVYPYRYYVTGGGLISYGQDIVGQCRSAAGYVDRILKGEKPADLPVQAPTKFELVINLKTAKALGLTIPETLLATADEVIQ